MSDSDEYGFVKKNAIRFVLNWLSRSILAGIISYSCWPAIAHYHYWFTWHVVLCTLGYLPLMAEALLLFAGDELWSRQISRKQKYFIHGVLITFATVIISAGNIDIMYYIDDGFHFNTAHGITGLISMIILYVSIILGYGANYAQKLKNHIKPVNMKFLHNFVGLSGYVIGIISLCYAYYTPWFVYYTTEESRLAALIFTIIGSLWTINTAVVSGFNQIKTMLNK